LRVGARLWVIGRCDAPYLPFEVEVGSVLRAEQRTRVDFPVLPLRLGDQVLTRSRDVDVRVVRGDGELRGDAAPAALELSLLIASGPHARGLRVDHGAVGLYPAGEITRANAALVARWSLPAETAARLSRVAAAPLHAQLVLAPDPVIADQPLRAS